MHDLEKSDSAIVAVKPPNKAGLPVAEAVERRAGAKGNANQHPRTGLSAGHAWPWCWLAYVRPLCLIVSTRGGNRMRESCKYGSVRGARGNSRPYREGPCRWPTAQVAGCPDTVRDA